MAAVRPVEPPHLSCEIGKLVILQSETQSVEGDDDTPHFCGIDRYSRWRGAKHAAAEERRAHNRSGTPP